MTNKYMYFVANWKMFGDLRTLNSLDKVIKFSITNKKNKFKIIYCPPSTLIRPLSKRLKKTKIEVGAQNCHYRSDYGAYTGSVNAKMIKDIGSNYVILGHSEARLEGDDDKKINFKIKSALDAKLKVIFCVGESLKNKKNNRTNQVIKKQINIGLKKINNYKNIIVAYEPVWSIGTGILPSKIELEKNINFIRKLLNKRKNGKKVIILYGGSVNSNNIKNLIKISQIKGFIVGGASLKAKNFIDIIKKSIN